jgi:hypothetical protein
LAGEIVWKTIATAGLKSCGKAALGLACRPKKDVKYLTANAVRDVLSIIFDLTSRFSFRTAVLDLFSLFH